MAASKMACNCGRCLPPVIDGCFKDVLQQWPLFFVVDCRLPSDRSHWPAVVNSRIPEEEEEEEQNAVFAQSDSDRQCRNWATPVFFSSVWESRSMGPIMVTCFCHSSCCLPYVISLVNLYFRKQCPAYRASYVFVDYIFLKYFTR